jgi:hypothetical protein
VWDATEDALMAPPPNRAISDIKYICLVQFGLARIHKLGPYPPLVHLGREVHLEERLILAFKFGPFFHLFHLVDYMNGKHNNVNLKADNYTLSRQSWGSNIIAPK